MKPTAEDERTAAEVIEQVNNTRCHPAELNSLLLDRIASAIAAEREKAAKIADEVHSKLYHGVDYGDESDSPAFEIAARIRAGDKQ